MGQRPLNTEQNGDAPRVTLRIATADLDRLDEAARRRGVGRSVAVRQALTEWLDQDEAATA
jgi:hypothetical protein